MYNFNIMIFKYFNLSTGDRLHLFEMLELDGILLEGTVELF